MNKERKKERKKEKEKLKPNVLTIVKRFQLEFYH